jgi:uncharacterized membrane protein
MELVQRLHHHSQNVNPVERLASIVAGTALGYFGIREALKHHSLPGAGLALGGAALIRHGITGYCDMYRSDSVKNTTPQRTGNATIAYQQGVRVDRTTTINASREQVYAFWRNLENLPRFMKHVQCVRQVDDLHSHWIVEGPAGQKIEWDAEIINEIPNELLAWRSLPGASVDNAGSVRFEHATAGRGTKVTVSLQYEPPAGQVGVVLAKLLGTDPEQEVDMELHRLKNIIETGEIPTCIGQPSGRADDQVKHAKKSAMRLTEKVHDASEASFPASDAPAYSHVNGR